MRLLPLLYAFAQLKSYLTSRQTKIVEKDSVLIIHAVFCPVTQSQLLSEFWRLVETGISSRLAEYCLKHLTVIQDVMSSMQDAKRPNRWCDPHHRKICQRIVDLVRRGPIPGGLGEVLARRCVPVSDMDVRDLSYTRAVKSLFRRPKCHVWVPL